MTNLTTEQLAELTERLNQRIEEFEIVALPTITLGIMRLAYDVITEWRAESKAEPVRVNVAPEYAFTRDANDHTVIDDGLIRMQGDGIVGIAHASVADFTEFEAAWPAMPDLQGEDVFAEHGEPTGTLAELDEALERELDRVDDALACGGPEAIPTPLDGLQIVAPPSLLAPATNGNLLAYIRKPQTLNDMERVKRQEAELQAVIATLRDMAVDGKMPTKLAYQVNRLKELPSWPTITTRYRIATWRQLAELCGLEYENASRYAGAGPAADPDDGDDATEDDADLLDDDDVDEGADADEDRPAKGKKPAGKRAKTGRKMGYEQMQRSGRNGFELPSLPQLVAEVQRQAMGGVMPTQAQFDLAKPANWGSATSHMTRLGVTWEQLRIEAGLKPNPRWARTWENTHAAL